MTDDEVWSLAIHYYDEDNIDVGKPISCGVVVNHKGGADRRRKGASPKRRAESLSGGRNAQIQQRHSRPKPTAKAARIPKRNSLFDF